MYPLEQRPGNLIPFSIYLNPLTQTRSSSTSGPPSFHSLSRPSLTLPPFPQVPAFISSRFLESLSSPLTSFPFGIAERKETDSFFFQLLLLRLFSSSSTFHYRSEFPFPFLPAAIALAKSNREKMRGERGRRRVRRRREGERIQ